MSKTVGTIWLCTTYMLRSIMLIHPFSRLGLSLHIGQHGYVADGPHDQERAQLRLLVHQQLFFHRHTMCSSSEVGWRELCIGNVLLIPLQHNHRLRGRLSTQHVVDSAHVAYKNKYSGVQFVPLYLNRTHFKSVIFILICKTLFDLDFLEYLIQFL